MNRRAVPARKIFGQRRHLLSQRRRKIRAMSAIDDLLTSITEARPADPLAPVTLIAPSHVAAIQLRRRLADAGAFAAVRFETLGRVAELLAAGQLAAGGKTPLVRPVGDYLAEQVALEASGGLTALRELSGFPRVLRSLFRRLRRGGITHSAQIIALPASAGHLPEVLRLYDRFRMLTEAFYDEDDLLDAADVHVRGGSAALADFGTIFALAGARLSASGASLLAALGAVEIADAASDPKQSQPTFVLAPDPASEVREALREVLAALESGESLHEIAIFHGASAAYRSLLRDALAAAGIPALIHPGIPLAETRAGRGAVALALLPERDYSRTAVIDVLALAPLRRSLPGGEDGERIRCSVSNWDAISREAGVTRGLERWTNALDALAASSDADIAGATDDEGRRKRLEFRRDGARAARNVITHLAGRLAPLREAQPAAAFVPAFVSILRDYFAEDGDGFDATLAQVEQLGAVAAINGTFSLGSFAQALRTNLETAQVAREHKFGEAVFISSYRAAAGLQFSRVIVCGAHEGGFPASAGGDPLVEDDVWATLRLEYPYIEDAALRSERQSIAASTAIAAARRHIVWCAPLYESGGTREFYPANLMVESARQYDPATTTGSALRRHGAADGWLRRGASPLGMQLRGPALDETEVRLREAILLRKNHRGVGATHRQWRPTQMIIARRGPAFTAWDGNLSALLDESWLELQSAVSPTSLEHYSACGFRYFAKSLLRLNVAEEPERRETMSGAERGTVIHRVLEDFFREQRSTGRPGVGEAWTTADVERLLEIADDQLAAAGARGVSGLPVFASHERRAIRADLVAFMEADNAFRASTQAVPTDFEIEIPEVMIGGVRLRGTVDRVDRTADGRCAWVIDYKTGSMEGFEAIVDADPFAAGKKLQLPTYLAAAAGTDETHALYWFISQRSGFEMVRHEPTLASQAAFARTLESIVSGIRQGAFPAVPGEADDFRGGFTNCRYCDFNRICSRRRDDAWGDKQGDAAAQPWLRVADAALVGAPE